MALFKGKLAFMNSSKTSKPQPSARSITAGRPNGSSGFLIIWLMWAACRQSAYWLRRQDHAADFRRRWDAALADAGEFIEALAMDRMVDGEEDVIERIGETVAVHQRPCDARPLLFYLKSL